MTNCLLCNEPMFIFDDGDCYCSDCGIIFSDNKWLEARAACHKWGIDLFYDVKCIYTQDQLDRIVKLKAFL